MKILLAVFISFFSLNASAQWYTRLSFWKKPERFPQIILTVNKTETKLLSNASFNNFNTALCRSKYSIDAEEAYHMKNLRRSMRYGQDSMRVQFDHLASFYFLQNRFSEAKWYMLQSNAISRHHKNYSQIVGSLLALADIKSSLGDFKQADADLSEAKTIASSHSLMPALQKIEEHSKQNQLNKEIGFKAENRYSDLL